ncbi:type II toxin-antitoxin system Phd/YefM family antitoxin [Candidatus Palauibacter sp.]|uniref:type II toxin-antitoxin system Phd/YefM family antitoxin n=1 Tax=Candidatus Palauibacter sp. TaxID=3101350 RepID=UPI003B01E5EA
MKEISYFKARRNLAALMDEVVDDCEPILIRRRGKEPVALVAADELTSWMETAHVLQSPANARHLRESMAQDDRGEGEVIDIDELARRLGLEDQDNAPTT